MTAQNSELRRILDVNTRGRRVLSIGAPGPVRDLEGFTVIGLDALGAFEPWPVGEVDAVVCFSGGRDGGRPADLRRLFRRIRGHLAPGGLLVLDSGAETGLAGELRSCGFTVDPAGATPGRLIARALPGPPSSLAVADWGTPADARLDLRYADDEAPWLDPSPREVWQDLMRSAAAGGADLVAEYPVHDPYGGVRGAQVVGRHFGCEFSPHQVTFAAGVTSLLHDLGGLADGGLIAAPALVHPDLESWAVAEGADLHVIDEPVSGARLTETVRDLRPALLHLDRPTFTGEVLTLTELEDLTRVASEAGTVVVVDEAPAPYLGPAGSAASLVGGAGNLVVLRGFTKAYSWGGLRGGFALASGGTAERVRELVTPLQMGELAFQAALRLLGAGDVFGRLRARIHEAKPAFADRVAAEGLSVIRGHPDIPWIVVPDRGGTATRFFGERGIRGLRPVAGPLVPPERAEFLHLTVPLSDERTALFDKLVAGPAKGGAHDGRR